MKRKIIKQGHNTLTLTLPSQWVKRFNLSAGSEIEILEKDNGLFISTEKKNEERKTEFDISEMDIPTIWKYFMVVYREGYDEVIVRFNPDLELENPYKFLASHKLDKRYKKHAEKKKIPEVLQGFVNRFIGFEIVEHGNGFIRIKEMGELTSKEFDNSLRRVFLLIQQMTEECVEAIEKNNPKILQHTHDVDINLDKFHDYCIRILNKVVNKDGRKTSLLFSTLYLLELIGDEFKNIAFHMVEESMDTKLKNLQQFAEHIKEQFDTYHKLFYKFNKEGVKSISDTDKKIYLNISGMYKGASEGEKEIFHHLRMIARYINALIELRIEMEF